MTKFSPRVSIGLPVYNGDNYLIETLDSLLAQTYTDFELIICDNASTDGTAEICQAYAARDDRIRYFRNETNVGAARNYNLTWEYARGEYFKWAAHDDPCAPQLIERCVTALDSMPDVIMAYGRTILIDSQGDIIEYHTDGFNLVSPHPHERLRQSFRASAWCHPVFGLIRRDVLARTGLIGAYPSSDKVLLGELAILGKCHEVPEFLAYRRLHPQISTEVNKTDESMMAWFDPMAKGKTLAPRFRRFVELIKAIERAKLPAGDRVKCYVELLRFYLEPSRLRGAEKDLVQLGRAAKRFLTGAIPSRK